MRKVKFLIITVAVSVCVIACSRSGVTTNDSTERSNVEKNNSTAPLATPVSSVRNEEIASGEEIYSKNCMICHKSTGVGGRITIEGKTIKPDDLTSQKIKKMSDEKIIGYVTNGVIDEGMPAFRDKLNENEIKAVVGYVRELQAK